MTPTPPSIADRRRSFRQLHESGCFVIPNPWDVGSAHYLQSLGFKALATTSAKSRVTWLSARPIDHANPALVVARALKPRLCR